MMKEEFERLAGYEVSFEDYNKVIEPMYMATNLSKEDFIKTIDKKRFEVKKQKSEKQIQLEADLKDEMEGLKEEVKFFEGRIETLKMYASIETDKMMLNGWKEEIKNCKEEIRIYKVRINNIKWVLAS